MAAVENQAPVTADSEPVLAKKEKKVAAPKTARAKPSHPPTSEMVNNAIKGLKERGGSSVQAIKKYLAANYKVDAEKMAPFIKKYLKSAVTNGALVQTKGKGASGSFKLASATLSAKPAAAAKKAEAKPKKAATATVKKTDSAAKKVVKAKPAKKEAKPKVAKVKKAAAPKAEKKTVAKPKVAAAVPASPKQKALSKAKKTKAGPTKKPKAPKPKTAKAIASPKKK